MTAKANPWMICSTPQPQARLRLFCFPYAGGGASVYRTWSDVCPPEIELWRIQLPGREPRLSESLFTRLTPLVQTLAPILRPHLHKPFVFFGHSMGALVAFELARRLRRHDRLSPLHLFVSAHRAPQLPDPDPLTYPLSTPAFIETLRRLQGTPEAILHNAELMELMLPVVRADFELCETYTYTTAAPLPCPISAFGGFQDEKVSRDELAEWRAQTQSAFILRMFPGNHFFLHSNQALLWRVLFRELEPRLQQMTEEGVSTESR